MINKFLLLLCFSIVLCSNVFSADYERSFTAGFGYIDSNETHGFNFNIGAEFVCWRMISNLNFLDLKIYQSDNSRYYMDTFSNGQSRCRDSETGQFAKTELCDGETQMKYSAMFDFNFLLLDTKYPFYVGGGYAVGDTSSSYVSVGLGFNHVRNSHWFIKGNFGEDLSQAYLGYSF